MPLILSLFFINARGPIWPSLNLIKLAYYRIRAGRKRILLFWFSGRWRLR